MYRTMFSFYVMTNDAECRVLERGVASRVLHSKDYLFEFVEDGLVRSSVKLPLSQFTEYWLNQGYNVNFLSHKST